MLPKIRSLFSSLRTENDFKSTEFLIVMIIIIVLVAAALMSYRDLSRKSANTVHDSNVQALVGTMYMVCAEYQVDNTVLNGEKSLVWDEASADEGKKDFLPGWGSYLEKWPEVPNASDAYKEAGEYKVYLKRSGNLVKVEPAALGD